MPVPLISQKDKCVGCSKYPQTPFYLDNETLICSYFLNTGIGIASPPAIEWELDRSEAELRIAPLGESR